MKHSFKTRLGLGLIVLAVGVGFQVYTSELIAKNFPDRQPIYDWLFDVLPYWPTLSWVGDAANMASVAVLALVVWPKNANKLPFVFWVIGAAYFIRGILIYLNPFGGPLGNDVTYGLTNLQQFGQFPSGHMMITVLVYLLARDFGSAKLRVAALAASFLEAFGLILSHGHYSIDVVGGLLVGYTVYHVVKPYEPQLTGD